jgi:geranylgeranyl diphosphate synthase type II
MLYDQCVEYINDAIAADSINASLNGACTVALCGGKRIRGVITMAVANGQCDVTNLALAVEFLHASSLVIDDLPAFDNDRLRRGRASVWAATSEATALMVSVLLASGSLRHVSEQSRVRVLHAICNGRGGLRDTEMSTVHSLVADVLHSTADEQLHEEDMSMRKTIPFFEFAFVAGWMGSRFKNADVFEEFEHVESLRAAGKAFGRAFQIADDIGDIPQDLEEGRSNHIGRERASRCAGAHTRS